MLQIQLEATDAGMIRLFDYYLSGRGGDDILLTEPDLENRGAWDQKGMHRRHLHQTFNLFRHRVMTSLVLLS